MGKDGKVQYGAMHQAACYVTGRTIFALQGKMKGRGQPPRLTALEAAAVVKYFGGMWVQGGGGVSRSKFFARENFAPAFIYLSRWPENPAGNFTPFQDCTVYYWAVPALHCQIPAGSRIVLRISRSFQDCILYFQGVPA